MKTQLKNKMRWVALVALTLPLMSWGQDEDPSTADGVESEVVEQAVVESEFTIGLYYLDHDSYRYGKYSGLYDKGVEPLVDFRIEKWPKWDSDDGESWSVQGWRLGLDSRRIKFDYNDLGSQSLTADYREIPNYRIDDGLTPYRDVGSSTLTLDSAWAIAPGSSNTGGFLSLDQTLTNLRIDTKRRRMDVNYSIKLSKTWSLVLDYRHETKKGEKTIGSLFGSSGGNPRSVILPTPVDYQTDNIEAMFQYATPRAQFGIGVYASFFDNDESSLIWQNAYGRQSQWAESVHFPGAQGALAQEPDNSYWQIKAHGGYNLTPSTNLSADVAFGQMKQNDALLPYTINPELMVHTPVPLTSLDAKIDTTMVNVSLNSQLARRLGLSVRYHLDDRDNKTPRADYPYIGGDSQDQRDDEDARINLPYSYRRQDGSAIFTYRLGGGTRLKGGAEYSKIDREYSEVSDADEWSWVAGLRVAGLEWAAFSVDYRNSNRDVDAYIGNTPLIESHLPGVIAQDEWENHPQLRKYFLTDRDRDEFRFRADVFPVTEINFGVSASYFKDDYDDGYFGLNEAKIRSWSLDFGWYPFENTSLMAFYTKEKYDSSQSSISFRNAASAADSANNWFATSEDKIDTYNVSLTFSEIGADRGWNGFTAGFDYTYSNTRSLIDVTATTLTTAPLPELRSKMQSLGAWVKVDVQKNSSIRLSFEKSQLDSADFALDNVVPDTLSNVLLLGESAANYDLDLITASWTYHF